MKIEEKKEQGVTTKYLGIKRFKDIETGEIVELEYVEKKVKHTLKRGWRRVYLGNFMEVLTGLYSASRKIDVVEFILDNLDSENKLTLTQNMIFEKTKISLVTINQTFKYLVAVDFMKKIGSCYIVNPKYVTAFGSDKKNATIAIKYSQDIERSLFDENDEK